MHATKLVVMADVKSARTQVKPADDRLSVIALASVLLRWRRAILALAMIGALVAFAAALLARREYVASATFIPHAPESGAPAGLATAIGQLGIRLPSTGEGWGPPIYVELLRSAELLAPLAGDTLIVTEEGGRRMAIADLLNVKSPRGTALRLERTREELNRIISADEDKAIGAVRVSVRTRWPSVSLALADSLVAGVNRFNLDTRKSQAAAERQFVEARVTEAQNALRGAEERLSDFKQRNKVIGSPELTLEQDRLQREVGLRQQVYTNLVQNEEEARIREVRDTPVITILESPRLPVLPESRQLVRKTLTGALAGIVLGIVIAFFGHGVAGARRTESDEAREFFLLVENATPRFLRRKVR